MGENADSSDLLMRRLSAESGSFLSFFISQILTIIPPTKQRKCPHRHLILKHHELFKAQYVTEDSHLSDSCFEHILAKLNITWTIT